MARYRAHRRARRTERGFERFFHELVDLGGVTQAEPRVLGELCARYELEMDPGSVPGLLERFGLRIGEPLV